MALSTTALHQENLSLTAFLEGFPTPLHHDKPQPIFSPWVFWSPNESSYSVDAATLMLNDNIKFVFSEVYCPFYDIILQVWAPVTIGGKRLLSTSAHPFAVSYLGNNLKKYRLHSMEYQYNIDDVNMQLCNIDDEEEDPKILSGSPASAFLNRLPEVVYLRFHQNNNPLARYASESKLTTCFMLPICSPSQPSSCIAVLEVSTHHNNVLHVLQRMKRELETAGLTIMSDVQERIPYKDINGLKSVSEEIKVGLETVCLTLNLDLAQVWIACEDENHVPLLSSLEGTQAKPILALKLTGYLREELTELRSTGIYDNVCNIVSLKEGIEPIMKTLQDYQPRFCKNVRNLSNDTLMSYIASLYDIETSDLIICLRNIDTGEFNYAFEFVWANNQRYVMMLEALLFTLKRCLPSFKFPSGAELGNELNVIDLGNSTNTEIIFFKIFQGNNVSPPSHVLEKGKKPTLVDHKTTPEAKYKTAPKPLSLEVIEKQFGNTIEKAVNNLNGGGDKSNVTGVENSTDNEIKTFKIFQRSGGSPMSDELEKGKKHKTARIELYREVIEQQFGNTQTVAARNLNVHLSTLKRKCKEFHIFEWPGPKVVKRKADNSCNYQSNKNEEDNGAIQEPSVVNRNENIVTIRAEYGADTIKFTINVSEATLVTVEKEISKRFKMTLGTFKLKYHDEVEWILLTCDEDMSDCIKSLNNVRLLVIPAT